jgi:hypothetical protein
LSVLVSLAAIVSLWFAERTECEIDGAAVRSALGEGFNDAWAAGADLDLDAVSPSSPSFGPNAPRYSARRA